MEENQELTKEQALDIMGLIDIDGLDDAALFTIPEAGYPDNNFLELMDNFRQSRNELMAYLEEKAGCTLEEYKEGSIKWE